MKKLLLILAFSLSLFGEPFKFIDSYDAAVFLAKKENKPLLIFMSQKSCKASKYMRENVFIDDAVKAYLKDNFIVAKLDVKENSAPEQLQVHMTPSFHFILPNTIKYHPSFIGAKSKKEFLNILSQAKGKDYFFATEVHEARNNKKLLMRDTDSDLGRYNLVPKEFDLKNLVDSHGHLCYSLVIAYVEISQAYSVLFPKGIVDRTDLRITTRNKPALIDAASLMSGARINFKTLSLDNSLGLDIVVQRISTDKTVKVSLRDQAFLKELNIKKRYIKKTRYGGKNVSAKDIDEYEDLSNKVIRVLLNTNIKKLVEVEVLDDYKFTFSTDGFSRRADTINKSMPR